MAISRENAAEACKKISSEAEKIIADGKSKAATARIIAGAFGAILGGPVYAPVAIVANPANYKGGNNTAETMTRNIIERDLSNDQKQTIISNCVNSDVNLQKNVINNTMCPICETQECVAENISQNNIVNHIQRCILQNALKTLLTKTDNLDAQTLATVIQKTEGLLTGDNDFKSENCNIVRTDMSSKQYFDARNKCSNQLNEDQINNIIFCGDMNDVYQNNQRKSLQDCINSLTYESTENQTSNITVKDEVKIDQKTTGLTASSSIGSSLISGIFLILSIVLALYLLAS